MRAIVYALVLLFGATGATGIAMASTSPLQIDGTTTIDAAMAKQLFDKEVPFVDVRNDSDFEAGRVPGAYHLDVKTAFSEESLGKVVGKGDEVVIYCNGESCLRSTEACTQAVAWGFTKVYFFRTGLPSWQSAGYPVE